LAAEIDPGDLSVLAARAAASGTRPVVLIDGRSGAGKTTLARELAPLLDAQLVSLDDLYPGWQGLAAGSNAVHETILRDVDPGWTRWDWAANAPAEWHPVDRERPIVIEGCGALSRANRDRATLGIWVDLPAAERRRRALEREPEFAAHWREWAAQERAHAAREHPRTLADLVVPG
jgi:uridine kinase